MINFFDDKIIMTVNGEPNKEVSYDEISNCELKTHPWWKDLDLKHGLPEAIDSRAELPKIIITFKQTSNGGNVQNLVVINVDGDERTNYCDLLTWLMAKIGAGSA